MSITQDLDALLGSTVRVCSLMTDNLSVDFYGELFEYENLDLYAVAIPRHDNGTRAYISFREPFVNRVDVEYKYIELKECTYETT